METILAYHCGPAMAGIKVSNIVSIYKDKIKNIREETDRLNAVMNRKDIYLRILCECDERALIIVYRKSVMTEHLNKKEIKNFLKAYNYPENAEVDEYLCVLRNKLKKKDFPHEIGVFLGYPLCDIEGFITRKSEYIFSGEWKVYENAEETMKLFERFEKCRRAIMKRIATGQSLERVFCCG